MTKLAQICRGVLQKEAGGRLRFIGSLLRHDPKALLMSNPSINYAILGALAGTGAGTLIDKKNRLRGALTGLGIGGASGYTAGILQALLRAGKVGKIVDEYRGETLKALEEAKRMAAAGEGINYFSIVPKGNAKAVQNASRGYPRIAVHGYEQSRKDYDAMINQLDELLR